MAYSSTAHISSSLRFVWYNIQKVDASEKKEKEFLYKKIKKDESNFEQKTPLGELEAGAGKIADAIIAEVGQFATGGSLSLELGQKVKSALEDAPWKAVVHVKDDDIIKQYMDGQTYLFLWINRRKKGPQRAAKQIFKKEKPSTVITIHCGIKWCYCEAGNEACVKQLEKRASTEATRDTWKWIESNEDGKWDDVQQYILMICNRQ